MAASSETMVVIDCPSSSREVEGKRALISGAFSIERKSPIFWSRERNTWYIEKSHWGEFEDIDCWTMKNNKANRDVVTMK